MRHRTDRGPTLISLFAGAGGLDIGLEDAGFDTLVANDIEPYACRTLVANRDRPGNGSPAFADWFSSLLQQRCYSKASELDLFSLHRRVTEYPLPRSYLQSAKVIEEDIRDLSSTDMLAAAGVGVGDIMLIAGGPPCQPFSRAGKRETVETATGRLFLEFVRVVDEMRPRWFLFENVKGLAQTRTEVLELHCTQCGTNSTALFDTRQSFAGHIRKTSYARKIISCPHCSSEKITTSWISKRGGSLDIIIREFEQIGYTCHWNILNAADYGAPQTRERLMVVGSRDGEDFSWPDPQFTVKSESSQMAFHGLDKMPWRTMRETLWRDGDVHYGDLSDEAVLWVKNVVRPHAEPVTWSLDRPSPTIGAHQGAKLALAPYGVPEEQLKRQQWHTRGRRQGDSPPVFVEHRYLSDEELLRLQTFPKAWFLYGTRMERAFQVGNAVPPVLGTAVGTAILHAAGERSEEYL